MSDDNSLYINFDDDGININANRKCIVDLNQSSEKLALTSTKEITLSIGEKELISLSDKGITLQFGNCSIVIKDSEITLVSGGSEVSISDNAINFK